MLNRKMFFPHFAKPNKAKQRGPLCTGTWATSKMKIGLSSKVMMMNMGVGRKVG